MTSTTLTIVGASTAGFAAAGALRRAGFDGHLVIVGSEQHLPYERPPLTKGFLVDDGMSRVDLHGVDDSTLDLDWRLGTTATGLDAVAKTLRFDDGTSLSSDGIVLACGTSPRLLPGTEGLRGIHSIRTIDDATALRSDLEDAPERVVVVGAGFIGCEVAASCRRRGHAVTLVDPLVAPLARVLPPAIAAVFASLHRDEGVDLRLGVGVDGFTANETGRVTRVHLSNGSTIDTTVVVVGIGVTPNTGWLQGSGLKLDDGIVCDATSTAAQGIVAAGDVARWPNATFYGELMRIEHWDHAFGHGEHAAASLLAGDAAQPFATVPWFWSDQYDRKVQMAGRVGTADDMVIVDGRLDDRRFVALFGRAGRLVGVVGMNRPGPVMRVRSLIAQKTSFEAALATFA